jgi:hypothetical protein
MHHLRLLLPHHQHILMRSYMFRRAAPNNQFMGIVIDLNVIRIHNNFVAKDPCHFFERNAFCFG